MPSYFGFIRSGFLVVALMYSSLFYSGISRRSFYMLCVSETYRCILKKFLELFSLLFVILCVLERSYCSFGGFVFVLFFRFVMPFMVPAPVWIAYILQGFLLSIWFFLELTVFQLAFKSSSLELRWNLFKESMTLSVFSF